MDELVNWALLSCGLGTVDLEAASDTERYDGDALLFSRGHTKDYKSGAKWLTSKLNQIEASDGIKLAADRLNLDRKLFSSHSWKIGGISELATQGHNNDVVRRLGDHAVNSVTSFLYQHDMGHDVRPLLYASTALGLTVAGISRICPILLVPYDHIVAGDKVLSLASIDDDVNFLDLSAIDQAKSLFSDSDSDADIDGCEEGNGSEFN